MKKNDRVHKKRGHPRHGKSRRDEVKKLNAGYRTSYSGQRNFIRRRSG